MNQNSGEVLLTVDFSISGTEPNTDLARVEAMLQFSAARLRVGGDVGIWLCSDEEIADLHLRYMGIPGPTDVITFPGDPPETASHLGDIAVSVDTAAAQSRDAEHTVGREIAYLCLHGLLHLAGFDDRDDALRRKMLRTQEELLDAFERRQPGEWGTSG